jgi:hypothetical protein
LTTVLGQEQVVLDLFPQKTMGQVLEQLDPYFLTRNLMEGVDLEGLDPCFQPRGQVILKLLCSRYLLGLGVAQLGRLSSLIPFQLRKHSHHSSYLLNMKKCV